MIRQLADLPCFAFELTYTDVAGERWYTTGLYLTSRATGTRQAFVEPKVGRVPEDGVVAAAKMPALPAWLANGESSGRSDEE